MTFSEKTARAISKYIVKLVRRQPFWLRKLFQDERVCFGCEDDGTIYINMDEALAENVKRDARVLIAKYMKTHPCEALGEKELN